MPPSSCLGVLILCSRQYNWAPSSEFVSSSIPSWQILTAHAQSCRGARDLAFCLKVPLDSLLLWASSGGSGETARMRRLAWTFAARISDKYQIRLTRPNIRIRFRWTRKNDDHCFHSAIFAVSIKGHQDSLYWLPKLHKRPYEAYYIENKYFDESHNERL